MQCPSCNYADTHVLDSRLAKKGRAVRRRRNCERCGARFTTYEEVEALHLTVIKRSGAREEYDRGKLEGGLRRALEKRPVPEERIARLISDIEYELQSKDVATVESRMIGHMVLAKLRDVDDVAYLRFASVYKSFGSAKSFVREAEKMGSG